MGYYKHFINDFSQFTLLGSVLGYIFVLTLVLLYGTIPIGSAFLSVHVIMASLSFGIAIGAVFAAILYG